MATFNTCTYTSNEPLTSSWIVTIFLDIFDENWNYIPNYYSGNQDAIKTSLEAIPNYWGVTFQSWSYVQIVKTPYELTNGAIDYWTSATPFTFTKTACSMLPMPWTTTPATSYELFSIETLHTVSLIELWFVYWFIFFYFLKKLWKILF